MTTQTQGIFQSDIIIREAFVTALADLRANPWLLDYVFASLPQDDLTSRVHGEKEIERAKEWFLNTDIPVFMNYRVDNAALPCITIGLQDSSESDFTLGDVHYVPAENMSTVQWPTIATFNPVSYNALTGIMVLPDLGVPIYAGMFIVDRVGTRHEILEVPEANTAVLLAGTNADFEGAQLKPVDPAYVIELESAVFKETYTIGVHVAAESVGLTFLHSIVVFILLRYKQALFEARGFERSQFSSSDMSVNPQFDPEIVFSRHINLYGYVRNYWPKSVKPKLMGIELDITAKRDGFVMVGGVPVPTLEAQIGDSDSLAVITFSDDDDIVYSG